MGTLIFIACALWFLTSNFPETFGFIGTLFSFIWNIVGSVVMFFVGIFSGIFGFFSGSLEWLVVNLGRLLAPVLAVLPDSPFIPLLACVLLGVLFVLLKRPGDDLNRENFDTYVKLTYAWCFSVFNLGMIVACSGNPLGWLSNAVDMFAPDFPMTMLNYAEWPEFARIMLGLTLFGGLLTSLIFGATKGLRSLVRTWVGLAFCGMLGYEYLSLRVAVGRWLRETLGFFGAMIDIPIGFAEYLIIIQFFFGIIVFVLPLGAISALNQISRENERRPASGPSSNPFDDIELPAAPAYPTYVTDEDGNNYQVTVTGDFFYIYLPSGTLSTKWEYIRGQQYFYLNGKRFYPHS